MAKRPSKPGLGRLNNVDGRRGMSHINSPEDECDPQMPVGSYLRVHNEDGRDMELFIGRGRGTLNCSSAGYYD